MNNRILPSSVGSPPTVRFPRKIKTLRELPHAKVLSKKPQLEQEHANLSKEVEASDELS